MRSTSLCAAGVVHACGSAPKPDIKPPLQKRILPEQGLSAVMANTGVDVSLGRVTKAFEIIPVYGRPVKVTSPACFHHHDRPTRTLGMMCWH